jgi:hypothetical protein
MLGPPTARPDQTFSVAHAAYTRDMRLTLIGRSVVCLTTMSSDSLDLEQFERALDLGRPQSQVATPPVLLADYLRLRLLAQAGQVQLEMKPNAGRDLIRRSARELLRQVRLHGVPTVGFNVAVRIDANEGEDLFSAVVHADVIAQRLAVDTFRPGLKATYQSEHSLDTLSIDPDSSDSDVWLAQMNRHYPSNPDKSSMDLAIAWLAAADHETEALVRRLLRSVDA